MANEKAYEELMHRRPKECKRRRMKPYVGGCNCWWCDEFDREMQSVIAERVRQASNGNSS